MAEEEAKGEEEVKGKVQIERGEVTPDQLVEIEKGDFLTVKEISERLRYSTAWVLWMLKDGRIKGIKPMGRRWRVPRSEYDRILKEGVQQLPREPEKIPITEIVVEEKVVKKVEESPKSTEPPFTFPLDFGGLFGGKK